MPISSCKSKSEGTDNSLCTDARLFVLMIMGIYMLKNWMHRLHAHFLFLWCSGPAVPTSLPSFLCRILMCQLDTVPPSLSSCVHSSGLDTDFAASYVDSWYDHVWAPAEASRPTKCTSSIAWKALAELHIAVSSDALEMWPMANLLRSIELYTCSSAELGEIAALSREPSLELR